MRHDILVSYSTPYQLSVQLPPSQNQYRGTTLVYIKGCFSTSSPAALSMADHSCYRQTQKLGVLAQYPIGTLDTKDHVHRLDLLPQRSQDGGLAARPRRCMRHSRCYPLRTIYFPGGKNRPCLAPDEYAGVRQIYLPFSSTFLLFVVRQVFHLSNAHASHILTCTVVLNRTISSPGTSRCFANFATQYLHLGATRQMHTTHSCMYSAGRHYRCGHTVSPHPVLTCPSLATHTPIASQSHTVMWSP